MHIVDRLPPRGEGHVTELWRLDDGRIVEVSTIPNTHGPINQLARTLAKFMDVVAPGDPSTEYFADLDPDQEETMAFLCNEKGKWICSDALVAASGKDSRQRVLDALEAGVSWHRDEPEEAE